MKEYPKAVRYFIDEEQMQEVILYQDAEKTTSEVRPYGTMLLEFLEMDDNFRIGELDHLPKWLHFLAYENKGFIQNKEVYDDLWYIIRTDVLNAQVHSKSASARIAALRRSGFAVERKLFGIPIAKSIQFTGAKRQEFSSLGPDLRPMVSEYIASIFVTEASVRHCECCGKLFVTYGREAVYCGRTVFPDGKTCAQKGAMEKYQKKVKNNAALTIYTRQYKKMYARIRYGYMTREEFMAWKEEAGRLLEACNRGAIAAEELEIKLNAIAGEV